MRQGAGRGSGLSKQPIFLWMFVLAGICVLITLLVLLGMPVAVAVPTVPTIVLLAVQVVRNVQGDGNYIGTPNVPEHAFTRQTLKSSEVLGGSRGSEAEGEDDVAA